MIFIRRKQTTVKKHTRSCVVVVVVVIPLDGPCKHPHVVVVVVPGSGRIVVATPPRDVYLPVR